jgi:uncharacterized caspase-like protein
MQGRWLWVAALVAAVVSIVVASDAARAQTPAASVPPPATRNVALVIGNANYAAAPKLTTPVNGANAVAQMFRDAGFSSVDLVLDADRSGFERAVNAFKAKAAGADAAVIYFAGHGVEVGGTSYLVPVDAHLASEGDLDRQAIALSRLVPPVADSKRLGLVILDAGRDNPFVNSMRRPPAASRASRDVDLIADHVLIAHATRAGATAEEGDGPLSPFTAALAKNLAVPGLDVRLAFARVRKAVVLATANRQDPFVYGSLDGNATALVQLKPEPGADDEAKADFELVQSINTRKAYEVFLRQHPTGPYADRAREAIKALEGQRIKPVDEQKGR